MTESKALERSIKAAMLVSLESREETMSSKTFRVAVVHPCRLKTRLQVRQDVVGGKEVAELFVNQFFKNLGQAW